MFLVLGNSVDNESSGASCITVRATLLLTGMRGRHRPAPLNCGALRTPLAPLPLLGSGLGCFAGCDPRRPRRYRSSRRDLNQGSQPNHLARVYSAVRRQRAFALLASTLGTHVVAFLLYYRTVSFAFHEPLGNVPRQPRYRFFKTRSVHAWHRAASNLLCDRLFLCPSR